ncbi:MAG: hypothetical protein ACI9EF_001457 [Pseudohongiellaceae bacterium]|jgi:hypothetical protein
MALISLAICYTGLFGIAFQTVRNSHLPGPAGRNGAIPVFQRRTLVSLMLVLACTVVNIWLIARNAQVPRPDLTALMAADLLALLSVLNATTALRQEPGARSAARTGLSLGTYCFAATIVWGTLSLSFNDAESATFIAETCANWGISGSTIGFISLFHYVLTALLVSAGFAAYSDYAELPKWNKDRAFCRVSVLAMAMAAGYIFLTWCVLRG